MRLALTAALCALALAAPPALGQQLAGPDGTSLNKVLVIGTDGTRWDLLDAAMKAGRAPNLARLRREGFGRPTLLEFGPNTFTLSEVGWSSIASGVWEDKHGVDGSKFNMDPGQATKNGYLDFLTRIENQRARLSTFLASDWDNLGLAENGGPIFGSAMDANFAARVPAETIENWNRGDVQVTDAATRYLRHGDPDAGFVYLGLVDETAHLAGSATRTYANAIATTDARIGKLLRAIRSRASYPFESWTILVVTDHGQKPLSEPSLISHFGQTKLELTSFVIGSGPGLRANVKKPKVVDILPTVLHQLGLSTPASWNIDGHSLSKARPASSASARVRGGRLVAKLRLGSRPKARRIDFHLPARARGAATVRVNGASVEAVTERKTVHVALRGRLNTVSLAVETGKTGGSLVVTMRNGKLSIPVS
jgi:Type I phosphodiesterase / nucleotide pyrophosphatase